MKSNKKLKTSDSVKVELPKRRHSVLDNFLGETVMVYLDQYTTVLGFDNEPMEAPLVAEGVL